MSAFFYSAVDNFRSNNGMTVAITEWGDIDLFAAPFSAK